jgi:hypothetical protein
MAPNAKSAGRHTRGASLVPKHAVALSSKKVGKNKTVVYRVGNAYYYVTYHPNGTYNYAVVQLPSSVRPASASSLPFHLGTVGSALGAVVRNLASLMRSGGGGFGDRIVPGFPTLLLLFGMMLAGSGAWLRRRGRLPKAVEA